MIILPTFYAKPFFYGLFTKKVNFGLDLQGGVQIVLKADLDSYSSEKLSFLCNQVKKSFRTDGTVSCLVNLKEGSIFVTQIKEQRKKVLALLKDVDKNFSIEEVSEGLKVSYDKKYLDTLGKDLIAQSMEVVRKRVDGFGTREPTIQAQGDDCITVQLPGENNIESLKTLLGKTAKLSFHLVQDKSQDRYSLSAPVLSGDSLVESNVVFSDNVPVVGFSFNDFGARIFSEITSNHVGKRLAILLDDKVLSAPVIEQHIPGGKGVITGNFTIESAQQLVLLLKSGSLPVPLKVIQESLIGPSLGKESVESSKIAGVVAFLLVIILMFWRYGIYGIFSNLALCCALSIILASLVVFNITLTLPGIAGIILTLGMAVDANIIIYEHIREVYKKNGDVLLSVNKGFDTSYTTIVDSNLTSVIAAVLLYIFGVGSVKGFAVTFGVGIAASMFACFWFSKPVAFLYLKFMQPKLLSFE
ncbi:protein translocase subunit SecD [Candidatus Sneabacter namystus]|uniref:Protein translocase subunit SecD n=1 Tax=Candidatus Sneabacter namystus TaxID=2601646 RepID=A0A5C0UJC7_9RICK|nr:protein translocase subunit SecD [Candidatus Sneabacter namystus]QEK39613.1 protein translocase subunit SecD [Candidatus Sneabacter namystus]